jgi:hypothetical protein
MWLRLRLRLPESGESAAGFFDASVAEAFAEFEGGGEALAAQFALAKLQVRETTKVETVCLSPGILTVWVFRAVKGIASALQGFERVACGEEGFGEDNAQVNRISSVAAGVCQEDAGFGFGNGLGGIPKIQVEFTNRMKAAELEFDPSGAVGELAGSLQVPCFLAVLGNL